jgi:hypothetical protein
MAPAPIPKRDVGIDVASYVQANFTPYDGDSSFLAGPTDRTLALWHALEALMAEEVKKVGAQLYVGAPLLGPVPPRQVDFNKILDNQMNIAPKNIMFEYRVNVAVACMLMCAHAGCTGCRPLHADEHHRLPTRLHRAGQ